MSTTGPKDIWDKAAIFLHPLGGLLTALAVGIVGFKGSQVIDRRQAADTNARLYSELMSRREESESTLRKDMFATIFGPLLQPQASQLDSRVLSLEMLAYNFHDSLNLKPLFVDIAEKVRESKDPAAPGWATRVKRIAREITAKQLFSLEGHGRSFRRSVDLEELARVGRGGIALDPESLAIDGRKCDVGLRVLQEGAEQIQVRLEVKAPEGMPQAADTRAVFSVGYFDFPMIDNTRLANGLRCAVTLTNYAAGVAAELTTVCFPGEYASIKDRPYYDEVIQNLQRAAQAERSEAGERSP